MPGVRATLHSWSCTRPESLRGLRSSGTRSHGCQPDTVEPKAPEEFDSEALKGNPLGDPHQRPVPIYLPPGYERGSRR